MTPRLSIKPIVVTRDEPDNGPLSTALKKLGLRVLMWPVICIVPPANISALDQALARITDFAWITFASQHSVTAVTSRVRSAPTGVRIAAVGRRTADALQEKGWRVDLVPEEATAEALVRAMAPSNVKGSQILFPASSRALPTLASGLKKHGAIVHQVEAYTTETSPLDIAECRVVIANKGVGAVTFTSPSTVIELDHALGAHDFNELLTHALAIALGPTTGQALTDRGYEAVLAEPNTLSGLAATTFRLMQARS